MVEIEQFPKDLAISPLIFGIKGRYLIFFTMLIIITLIITIVIAVILYFNHKIGLSFLAGLFGFFILIGEYFFFRFISIEKKFSKVKNDNMLISNHNIQKFLD